METLKKLAEARKRLRSYSLYNLTNWLLASWWCLGFLGVVAGFGGFYRWPLAFLLAVPFFILLIITRKIARRFTSSKLFDRALVTILACIWLVHATGLLVPETAFDAIWYHHPVIAHFAEAGKINFVPELYQSANPLFSDLLLGWGYLLGGVLGARVVAYGVGLSLVLVSYQLARRFLTSNWSLVCVIFISLLQVLTWQSSSFYVDVAKALWEVSFLLVVLVGLPKLGKSAALLGASLATKAFSIVLLPVFGAVLFFKKWRIRQILLSLALAVALAFPFYIWSWLKLGSPLYPITYAVGILGEIGGQSAPLSYLLNRLQAVPTLPWQLLVSRDYTSPLLLVTVPLLVLLRWNQDVKILGVFILGQLGLWWFVPPLSSRYALSGFVVWLVLATLAIANYSRKSKHHHWAMVTLLVVVALFQLAPRLVIAKRNLEYVATGRDQAAYITSKLDGTIDVHLKRFYGLE